MKRWVVDKSAFTTAKSKWGSTSIKKGMNLHTQYSLPVGQDSTIEFWLWLTPDGLGNWQEIINFGPGDWRSPIGSTLLINSTQFILKVNGVDITPRPNHSLVMNNWNHIALVTDDSGWSIYTNGVKKWSGTLDQFDYSSLRILGGAAYQYNYMSEGYVNDVRVSSIARYKSNFTPPTGPLPLDSDTVSLISCDQPLIPLSDDKDSVEWEFIGEGAKSNGSTSKHGSRCAETINKGALQRNIQALGTDDFTVEFWINHSSYQSGASPLSFRGTTASPTTSSGMLEFRFAQSERLSVVTFQGNSFPVFDKIIPVPFGNWVHIALTRQAGVWRAFSDGVKIGDDISLPRGNNITATLLSILGAPNLPSENFQGLMDDVRVTKGFARYTSNFTPPGALNLSTDPNAGNVISQTDFEQAFSGTSPPIIDQVPEITDFTVKPVTNLSDIIWTDAYFNQVSIEAIATDPPNIRSNNAITPFINSANPREDFFNKGLQNSFIEGKAIRNNEPLKHIEIRLFDKSPNRNLESYGAGIDGSFVFHNLPPWEGYFEVLAIPKTGHLNNALVWDKVTATSYDISVSGRFTRNTVEGVVDSDVRIESGFGPFEVELVGGEIPPGTNIVVDERNIRLEGPTSFFKDSYAFDLKISSLNPNYTSPKILNFEITDAHIKPMGRFNIVDGSNFRRGAYSEAIIDLEPIGYWPIDDDNARIAIDKGPKKLDGTWNGSSTAIIGGSSIVRGLKHSIAFGSQGWIQINDVIPLMIGKSFSILCWSNNPKTMPQSAMWGINTYNGGNVILLIAQEGIKTRLWHEGSRSDIITTSYVWGDEPTMTCLTYDNINNMFRLYTNGILVGSASKSVSISPTDVFSIGQEFDNANVTDNWVGSISGFAVFDKLLDSDTVSRLYDEGYKGSTLI